jgi:adenylyltransferase/sulfurtransferase
MSGLAEKRVLLIGAGGLAAPVASLLARAGVGRIEVADDDFYRDADVGSSKAGLLCARIASEAKQAGHVGVVAVAREMRVVPDNVQDIVGDFDLVIEGADNFASKFLIADACALAGVASVQAGAVRWTGWALANLPHRSACLRCVFEDIPEGPAHGCSEAGVVGPVVGVVGAVQAALALRVLSGDARAAGVLHHYRALSGTLRACAIVPRERCSLCTGQIHDLSAARYQPRECAA